MEIPDPRQVYSGAQPCGTAAGSKSDNEIRQVYAGDRSDIEVVSDTKSEVTMPDDSTEVGDAMSSSIMADRHAMPDVAMDIEGEVSQQSVHVDAVMHSYGAVRGENVSEHPLAVTSESKYQGLPVKPQQWRSPVRKDEASSKHSRQSNGETSGISRQSIAAKAVTRSCATGRSETMRMRNEVINDEWAPATAQQQYSSRYNCQADSAASGIVGEQRRLLDDWRAELTEAMRVQQEMFLNTMARLEALFRQTIEGSCSSQTDAHDVPSANDNKRVQPRLAHVGGVRGPSTSQTGVCRPEDVSQSSHNVAEVSSMRSAQSDRTSVWVSGGEDNGSQLRGNALVDAASVVGPRHESVRQCSQYELSGPGMLQMIPGGMPSGVPPSVCPPADAMCQQYMDSHGIKSQVAHTDTMRYSSEMSVPVESVRYCAPNMCTPVDARVFSEPAPSSNVRCANNFDIGRTVVNQLPNHMQSQQFRGGQTTEPRPPGSRNETTHTSFDNEKRALVHDIEVTNGEANVVAADEKCEQKVSSSKKSTKKKKGVSSKRHKYGSRGRSAKSSRSRSGGKKSDSDSESQNGDNDDKKRKGQSNSGTRPRKSRSKRRRASRSKSASSTSGRRRASSSIASRKRRPGGDREATDISSEGSSTDTDSDESESVRSKHVLKPPKFDGKTSFESFWAQFQNCVTHNKWTRSKQLVYLKNALEKDAANVLWDYGTEVTESLSRLTKTLKMRFGGDNFAEKNRMELRNRRRSPTETLTDLHIDIRRLSALAYPDTDHNTREVISMDYFIDALGDPELGLKIRERHPKDLDGALHIALQLEVWRKDSERLSQTSPQPSAENKKLRDVTYQGEISQTESESDTDSQRMFGAKQMKVLKKLRQTIEAMGAMQDTPRPSYSGNKSQQGAWVPVKCYACGQSGHIARNCPMQSGVNGNFFTASAGSDSDQSDGGQASPQVHSQVRCLRSTKDKSPKIGIRVWSRACKILALLDTGSDITIAGRDIAHRCGWKLKGHNVNPIRVANDKEVVVDGIATVVLSVNGTSTEIEVLVTRDISGLILGIDWMTKQGPSTFDFHHDRVRFGNGKWLQLLKIGTPQMVRRCYVDHGTVLKPTDQLEADMRLGRKGITEPNFGEMAQHVALLDKGSIVTDVVRLDSAVADNHEEEVVGRITASLAGGSSAERQAEIKALLTHPHRSLLLDDYAIVSGCIDMDEVSQTSQLLRRQAFESAKSSNRETDEILKHDVITVVASPWASNVVHVADAPLNCGVDCSRLNGTSSQEQDDAHEYSAKVTALGSGTESQVVLRHHYEAVATLLCERLPSVMAVSVGDAEVCCDNLPVQLDSPTVHTVIAVIKGEEDIFGLAGGSFAAERLLDRKIGALVAMHVCSDMPPGYVEVNTECELMKTLLLGWRNLVMKDGVVYCRQMKFKSDNVSGRMLDKSCDQFMQLCEVDIATELSYADLMGVYFDIQCTQYSGTLLEAVMNNNQICARCVGEMRVQAFHNVEVRLQPSANCSSRYDDLALGQPNFAIGEWLLGFDTCKLCRRRAHVVSQFETSSGEFTPVEGAATPSDKADSRGIETRLASLSGSNASVSNVANGRLLNKPLSQMDCAALPSGNAIASQGDDCSVTDRTVELHDDRSDISVNCRRTRGHHYVGTGSEGEISHRAMAGTNNEGQGNIGSPPKVAIDSHINSNVVDGLSQFHTVEGRRPESVTMSGQLAVSDASQSVGIDMPTSVSEAMANVGNKSTPFGRRGRRSCGRKNFVQPMGSAEFGRSDGDEFYAPMGARNFEGDLFSPEGATQSQCADAQFVASMDARNFEGELLSSECATMYSESGEYCAPMGASKICGRFSVVRVCAQIS